VQKVSDQEKDKLEARQLERQEEEKVTQRTRAQTTWPFDSGAHAPAKSNLHTLLHGGKSCLESSPHWL
jgi:hypothetical protein